MLNPICTIFNQALCTLVVVTNESKKTKCGPGIIELRPSL